MTFLLSLLTGKVIPILGGVVALAMAFFGMRFGYIRKGRGIEKAKQREATKHSFDTRDDVDDAIAGRTDDQNRKRLKKWSRN